MDNTMSIWDAVCKTNPAHTKKANVRGNQITAICPQSQIMAATKLWGPYGQTWGFSDISIDYSLRDLGIISGHFVFFFPDYSGTEKAFASFPIINSIGLYRDKAQQSLDLDYAKKLETDTVTKALSKLGFNADVFLGRFDDVRYVAERTREEAIAAKHPDQIACEELYKELAAEDKARAKAIGAKLASKEITFEQGVVEFRTAIDALSQEADNRAVHENEKGDEPHRIGFLKVHNFRTGEEKQ